MAATPRRSARLESKVKEKLGKERWRRKRALILMDKDEEEEDEDVADSGGVVIVREREHLPAKNKTNDFLKVHSSYNADQGLDCYEQDFIDDDEGDGDGDGEDDDDDDDGDGEDDSDKERQFTRSGRKRRALRDSTDGDYGLVTVENIPFSKRVPRSSRSPSNGKGVKPSHRGNKRVKVVRCLDSSSSNSGDDSKSGVVAAVDEQEVRRTPSSRARQLRETKENRTESTLKKLRRQRARARGAKGILSGSSISDSDPDQGVDDDTTLATADPSYQLRHALFSSEASEDTDHWLVSDSDKEPDEPLPFLSNAEDAAKDWRWLMSVCGMFDHINGLDRGHHNVSEDPRTLDIHGFPPAVYAAARAQGDVMATLLVDPEWVCCSIAEKGTNLLNIILEAPLAQDKSCDKQEVGVDTTCIAQLDDACLACLKVLQRDHMSRWLHSSAHPTPLDVAVWYNRVKCVSFLVASGASLHANIPDGDVCGGKDTFPPSLLHLAILSPHTRGRDMLSLLLPTLICELELRDSQGYTPAMLAAEKGDEEALVFLLDSGAAVHSTDPEGTSPLHLAALSGSLACVELLIGRGHPVDCRDGAGWPPLLYAHFEGYSECVLMLMRAKPRQLSVLSELLRKIRADDVDGRMRVIKVVRSLLLSLAHHEVYYATFNDFIHSNPSVLEDHSFGFMKHCMGLLSLENRIQWMRAKFDRLSGDCSLMSPPPLTLKNVDRDDVFNVAVERLGSATAMQCWAQPLFVTFNNEAGICAGPRRELWSGFCKALASGEGHVFTTCDDGQLGLQPYAVFGSGSTPNITLSVARHTRDLHTVGMLFAAAVFHGDTLPLNLAKPLIKQLLGIPSVHPDDLQFVDKELYHGLTEWLQTTDVYLNDLELAFVCSLLSPFDGTVVDIPIMEGGRSLQVTADNKLEYIKQLSHFKLEGSVREEMQSFLAGFWKVIPKEVLRVFNPDEFSLILSGVPTIDVEDWCTHTEYHGLSSSSPLAQWFWRLVRSLKEEEKALLLKFCTGSPRVPAGGFCNLQGLRGVVKFQILLIPGVDKIPLASTCFNTLKLTEFSCEQSLRDKVLIAIRYGCEGFEFS